MFLKKAGIGFLREPIKFQFTVSETDSPICGEIKSHLPERMRHSVREKTILIFSEGNTRMQKKLAPLQKGLARLAFGAYAEKNVQDIQIVPVGVNYSNGKLFRSDVSHKNRRPPLLK